MIGSGPDGSRLRGMMPIKAKLLERWGECEIDVCKRSDEEAVDVIHEVMNEEVKAGSYPQSEVMDREALLAYYFSHVVLVARSGKTVVGSMYVKPNFPGRCGHICNGGLLVVRKWRRRGVGYALAEAFQRVACALGYKAAFFNLVFFDNPASLALWKRMGYEQVGRVPKAKQLKDGSYVDAAMLYKPFDVPSNPPPSSDEP